MSIIFLILICIFCIGALSFAPWVPTGTKDLERIYKLSNPNKDDVFYDLGCGDGRLVFEFTKNGIKSVGYEISIFFYFLCLIKKIIIKNNLAKFKFGNFYNKNLSDANIVFIFGLDKTINKDKKFREKLEKELKPGTKIISYLWEIDWLKPIKIDKPNKNDLSIFLYEL